MAADLRKRKDALIFGQALVTFWLWGFGSGDVVRDQALGRGEENTSPAGRPQRIGIPVVTQVTLTIASSATRVFGLEIQRGREGRDRVVDCR